MVARSDVVTFLNEYLAVDKFAYDDCWNGLQVEGKESVSTIVFTTDAGIKTFEKAVTLSADMIVVHHGLFWKRVNPSIVSYTKKRVELLLDHGISLYASHLPLDKHAEVGNNAQLLALLGLTKGAPFALYQGDYISCIGKSDKPLTIDEIVRTLEEKLSTQCMVLPFGPQKIKTVAVCSGGAGYGQLIEAINCNVDLFISGEQFDCYHVARDAGINVIFAGHHATETVGVKALAKVVQDRFAVKTHFIDVPTNL